MHKVKRVGAALAAAGSIAVASLLVAVPAQAATCHHSSCTGLNPNTAGCGGAMTLHDQWYEFPRGVLLADVELRYSPTASCGAFWARTSNPSWNATAGGATISMDRMFNYNGITASISTTVEPGHSGYTRMWGRLTGFSYRACMSFPAVGRKVVCTNWVKG